MQISGIVEVGKIKFIPKVNPKNPEEMTLDYAKVLAYTYDTNADGSIKKNKDGKELKSEWKLRIYGKVAKHLHKLVKTDKKDISGLKLQIKTGELRDEIEKYYSEDEDKEKERRIGKFIKVGKCALVGKTLSPELIISGNFYVSSKKKGEAPAVEEKEIKGKTHLVKASLTGIHYYYVSKDESEAMFLNIESLDNFDDEDKKYKNKTGTLINHVKAKQVIHIVGSLNQSTYEDKTTEEIKEWIKADLLSFEFVSMPKSNRSDEVDEFGKAEDFDTEEDDDDNFDMSDGNDSDLIGDDEIPF